VFWAWFILTWANDDCGWFIVYWDGSIVGSDWYPASHPKHAAVLHFLPLKEASLKSKTIMDGRPIAFFIFYLNKPSKLRGFWMIRIPPLAVFHSLMPFNVNDSAEMWLNKQKNHHGRNTIFIFYFFIFYFSLNKPSKVTRFLDDKDSSLSSRYLNFDFITKKLSSLLCIHC
jgi:hypothetical protein